MSNIFCFLSLIGVILFSSVNAVNAAEYAPLTQEEAADFQNKMNQAIVNAEQAVKDAEVQATRKDVSPTWNSKLAMQNAIVQLEVKKTLMNNFKGTESLQSAAVRQKLLEVLNRSVITTADLTELQSLVLDEKAKIHAENMTH